MVESKDGKTVAGDDDSEKQGLSRKFAAFLRSFLFVSAVDAPAAMETGLSTWTLVSLAIPAGFDLVGEGCSLCELALSACLQALRSPALA